MIACAFLCVHFKVTRALWVARGKALRLTFAVSVGAFLDAWMRFAEASGMRSMIEFVIALSLFGFGIGAMYDVARFGWRRHEERSLSVREGLPCEVLGTVTLLFRDAKMACEVAVVSRLAARNRLSKCLATHFSHRCSRSRACSSGPTSLSGAGGASLAPRIPIECATSTFDKVNRAAYVASPLEVFVYSMSCSHLVSFSPSDICLPAAFRLTGLACKAADNDCDEGRSGANGFES